MLTLWPIKQCRGRRQNGPLSFASLEKVAVGPDRDQNRETLG